MKKVIAILGVVLLTGCLVRTYTTEKPRTDIDVQGNQGYYGGNAPAGAPKTVKKKTRRVAIMEIEFGHHAPKDLDQKEPVASIGDYEPSSIAREVEEVEEIKIVTPADLVVAERGYDYYTVKENDTLQKISEKFYSTTRKWMAIYEANKDVMKGPDKLFPGVTLKIPVLD